MALKILNAALLTAALCLAACDKQSAEHTAVHPAAEPVANMATLERTPSPDGARVFFISPTDGDTVSSPVRIEFGIEGMSVTKAGDNQPNSGHHHLVIDADLPEMAMPIPANANYVHFGDGRTATEIALEPGQHSLRLLLGDHRHIPHDPPVHSDSITITVE